MQFNDYLFRERLEKAQETIRRVLAASKAAALKSADEVPHRYADKYLLVEQLANSAVSSTLQALSELGLTGEQLQTLVRWSRDEGRAVTLSLEVARTCVFARETQRDEEDPRRTEIERTGFLAGKTAVRTVTRVTEYHFDFRAAYVLRAYCGVGEGEAEQVVLVRREAAQECVVRSKTSPFPAKSEWRREAELGWLLRHVTLHASPSPSGSPSEIESASAVSGSVYVPQVQFRIDRASEHCLTPRRNADTEAALRGCEKLGDWCGEVAGVFAEDLWEVQRVYGKFERMDEGLLRSEDVFVPVLAMFEEEEAQAQTSTMAITETAGETETEAESQSQPQSQEVTDTETQREVMLRAGTVSALVGEQRRSLKRKLASLEEAMAGSGSGSGSGGPLVSATEGKIVVAVRHVRDVMVAFAEGVNFVEEMLRKQLIAAVGKEVTPADLSEYMDFHYRKVLKSEFAPRALSHAVRRTAQHSPEGSVRIEAASESSGSGVVGGNKNPIMAFSHTISSPAHADSDGVADGDEDFVSVSGPPTMEFSLNATTTVRFRGERHVHCWLGHRFSDSRAPSLQLAAETRQFCSFVVLVGRITSASTLDVKHAFIVQNKDLVVLPLLLETLPTPKEFRDAIESLSPEQQRFAKAFRAMQLESTLFAVCVVQIKPQLEQLLRLEADSLTKEIRLTQDLLRLFVEYQLPSDLLSFDGPRETSGAVRLSAVKEHVRTMLAMVDEKKNEELAERNREREFSKVSRGGFGNANFGASPQMMREESGGGFGFGFGGGGVRQESRGFGGFPSPPPPAGFALSLSQQSAPLTSRGFSAPAPPAHSFSNIGFASTCSAPQESGFSFPPQAKPLAMPAAPMMSSLASAPAPAPAPPKPSVLPAPPSVGVPAPQKPQTPTHDDHDANTNTGPSTGGAVDLTQLPVLLDQQYDKYDRSHALRPTIIKVGPVWNKTSQKQLLGAPTTVCLGSEEQDKEKRAAFDLLDALSRSGGLVLENVSLHVVIAATQSFDDTLMDCLVRKNLNPIERVERSALLMSSVLHGVSARELVVEGQVGRLLALEDKEGKMFDEE